MASELSDILTPLITGNIEALTLFTDAILTGKNPDDGLRWLAHLYHVSLNNHNISESGHWALGIVNWALATELREFNEMILEVRVLKFLVETGPVDAWTKESYTLHRLAGHKLFKLSQQFVQMLALLGVAPQFCLSDLLDG